MHFVWYWYDKEESLKNRWKGGTEEETIRIDKISDFGISPISILDDNFNIREPRTSEITIVNDPDDDKIQNFVSAVIEAEEFKKKIFHEIGGLHKEDEERVDVIKIKIEIYDNLPFCLFLGYIDKASININYKEMTFSFSMIDPLYLYKLCVEDALVYTADVHKEDSLNEKDIIKILFFSDEIIWGNNKRLVYPTGIDDKELVDVSDMKKEIENIMSISNLKRLSLRVLYSSLSSFVFRVINVSAPSPIAFGHAGGYGFSFNIENHTPEGIEFHKWYDNIQAFVRQRDPYRKIYSPDESPIDLSVEYIFSIRATADQKLSPDNENDDVHNFKSGDKGIYLWIFRHTVFKFSGIRIRMGDDSMATMSMQEWKRYKIVDSVYITEETGLEGVQYGYKQKGGKASILDDYRSPVPFTSGIFNPFWQWEYDTLYCLSTGEIKYSLKETVSNEVHPEFDLPRIITLIPSYSGNLKIDNFYFGEASVPALDMLKFLTFVTGSYIKYCEKTNRIKIESREKMLVDDDREIVYFDKAESDDTILDIVVQKEYREAYNSDEILDIYFYKTAALVRMYNKIYENVFGRNILQKNVTIHRSAEYFYKNKTEISSYIISWAVISDGYIYLDDPSHDIQLGMELSSDEWEGIATVNLVVPYEQNTFPDRYQIGVDIEVSFEPIAFPITVAKFYIPPRKIVQNISLNKIVKLKEKFYRVMSILFPEDETIEYLLWSLGMASTPEIFPSGGEYAFPIDVHLDCVSPKEVEIRYTLDGNDPTKTSTLYTGDPITITEDTQLKARSFHWMYEPSYIAIADYSEES